MEVPLCGHATVATAAALLEGEGVQCSELRFQTVHCGVLTVTRESGLYHLSVPLLAPGHPHSSVAQPCDAISKVHSCCSTSPQDALPPRGSLHHHTRHVLYVVRQHCMMLHRVAHTAAQLGRCRRGPLHVPRLSWAAFQGHIAFTPGTAASRSMCSWLWRGLRQGNWNPWQHLLQSYRACRDAMALLESLSAVQVHEVSSPPEAPPGSHACRSS